ncbi:MAG: MFS transporter [Chloroflexi bacterium]|nr:MFS transporter [Chloroflexota bacterium]
MSQPIGYLALIRGNREFTKLWLGQMISLLGDWFNQVAALALIYDLTKSGMATGVWLITSTLPAFFLAPFAGVVVDRMDRRRVMIVADLGRAALALGMLVVRVPEQIWILYGLTALLVSFSAFFQPAQNAAIPNLVPSEHLVVANALSSATWGMMLAIGAAVGGVMIATVGRDTAFVINSLSFVFSAAMIAWIRKSFSEQPTAARAASNNAAQEFKAGLAYLRAQPQVLLVTLFKTGWGLAGGVFLLLTIFATSVFQMGAAGIGWLYAARGLGVFLGPYLAQPLVRDNMGKMRLAIFGGLLLAGASYFAFSRAPFFALAALFVIIAHIGGGTAWILSSTILQILVPDRLRGRIFSIDFGLYTISNAFSTFLVGAALESFDARFVGTAISTVFIGYGLVWGGLVMWSQRRDPHAWSDVPAI